MENNEANSKVLERIEACIAEKATTLDLSSLGLEEIPKEVGKCVWLQELNLSNNQITEIKGLEQLIELEELYLEKNKITEIEGLEHLELLNSLCLSFNRISEIKGLESLSDLEVLDLSNNTINKIGGLELLIELNDLHLSENQITDIEELSQLAYLETLDLSRNLIREIKGLEKLMNLTLLDLSGNYITEIKGLELLVNLEYLDLYENRISEIKGLEKLVELKSLSLSDNRIDSTIGLEKLVKLRKLYLHSNQIRELKMLSQLVRLQEVYLQFNKIEETKELAQLIELQKIDLANNQIESIDALIQLTGLGAEINIDNNPILEILPIELAEAGWPSIKDWIIEIQKKTAFISINEVKLLLLGNTNVGKSNLLHYFETGKTEFDGTSTHGIRYKMLQNLVKGVSLNCWDFGGQEFYHATHQLFFSTGALHLVLWCKEDVPRDGQNQETCFDLNYWLRCIEQLIGRQKEDAEEDQNKGNKIDALICENKIDLINYKSTLLNQTGLQEAFSDLELSFVAINLKPLKYMDGLKELISEKVGKLVNEWPPFYAEYLKKIRASKAAFVLVKDVLSEDEDDTIERVERTMKVFNNMGLLLYFPTIIKDKVFTQPQVLLDLLYEKVLGNPTKDCISHEEIKNSIARNKLKLSTEQVTRLLLHFDLVFQIPDEPKVYFIPQYLSAPSSFIDFFQRHQFSQANIRIGSDNFLMNVAMLKVFGNYGRYVKKDNKQEHLFWKDGIVIEKDRMLLMVKFDRAKQCIELYQDNHHNNFALQKEVVKFILDIPYQKHIYQRKNQLAKKFNVALSEIKVETKDNLRERGIISWYSSYFNVLISLDGKFFASWNTIAKQVEQGIFQVQAVAETLNEDTKEVVRKVKTISVFDYNKYLPEKDKGQMKKLFISYSKEDLRMVDKFIEHLSALKLDGKVADWYCTELTAGSDWNHEIQEHFDAADIVCFMISPNFMKTKYIHEHEIKKAFERKAKGDNLKIVPIILDFCKWTTKVNNLGDFTALPYMAKPVADFKNENMAWYIIQECLRLMIEKDLNPTSEDFYNTQPLPKDVLQILVRIAEGRVDNNTL